MILTGKSGWKAPNCDINFSEAAYLAMPNMGGGGTLRIIRPVVRHTRQKYRNDVLKLAKWYLNYYAGPPHDQGIACYLWGCSKVILYCRLA